MTTDNVLFFLADAQVYKFGKINLLSAKSSTLKSREIIKKLQELREREKEKKANILRIAKELDISIQKFKTILPRTHEDKLIKEEDELPRKIIQLNSKERKRKSLYKDEISQELDLIQEKLKELGVDSENLPDAPAE